MTVRQTVSGWGRAPGTAAQLVRPTTRAELADLVETCRRAATPMLARGLGRAYGDAAQCAGGVLVEATGLDRVLAFETATGMVRVEAGVSLDALVPACVAHGWFVPVTPGTAHVTIGGAIAADVHGKNHHRDGAIGDHVEDLVLYSPDGCHEIGPDADPELFWATVGGMGLTGVIAEARLQLLAVESAYMVVDTERAGDLDACMARLSEGDDRYRYSVAWVDAIASGARLGRSVITRADHARLDDLGARERSDPLTYTGRERISVPVTPPINLLNAATVAAFNELWYRKAPPRRTGEIQPIAQYFYPLDALGAWNRLYGRRGFTQYQFVVPFGSEHVVAEALEALQACGAPSFLAVLKRFGPADRAPLSFPSAGWTLALDLALGRAGLAEVLDDLDGRVAAAGGRVYFAKDGRVRPDLVAEMYPRRSEFLAVRDRVDPEGLMISDLARRTGLVGAAASAVPA